VDERPPARSTALEDLFRAEYEPLVRLAWLLVRDRGVAEDVAQEAFLGLFRRWETLQDPAAARAYLRTSVVNAARSRARRDTTRRRLRSVAPTGTQQEDAVTASAEDDVFLRERERDVLDALAQLPRRQRECLVLRYFLDESELDTAALLGISPGSVKSHVHRGLRALSSTWKDDRA
jgi:RNA polymerase sigma-70 factor (sigma-E family)